VGEYTNATRAAKEALEAAARLLKLPGLGGIEIIATKKSVHNMESPASEGPLTGEGDRDADEDIDEEMEESGDIERELPPPSTMTARRAHIPLDFNHPASTNTVPVGLLKALVSGDRNSASAAKESEGCSRRIVRSWLSSREIFEHASCPSLDGLCVPAIHRMRHGPWSWGASTMLQEPPHKRMTTARPFPRRAASVPRSRTRQITMRLEAGTSGGAGSASADAAINEVVPLFHTQLQESAARGLNDSQVDASGELDFQLVKDIVEQGHAEARAMIQMDLERILRCVEALHTAEVTPITDRNAEAMLEE
jgi:hypothetical protein